MNALPILPDALELARAGFTTGASRRNFAGYGDSVTLSPSIDEPGKALLTDPQTSGGLLVSCRPEAVPEVLRIFAEDGFSRAAVIGDISPGQPGVRVD